MYFFFYGEHIYFECLVQDLWSCVPGSQLLSKTLKIVHYSRKILFEYKLSEIICCVAFSVCITIPFYHDFLVFERGSSSGREWIFCFLYPFVQSRRAPKVKGTCLSLA